MSRRLEHGTPTWQVRERARKYKHYFEQRALQHTPTVWKYKEQVKRACSAQHGARTYVPGAEIGGDALRTFQDAPVITGPLVCQLCESA